MARLSWKKNINVNKVVTKVIVIVLGLYVGGFVLTEIGTTLKCTYGAFYKGLSLIGYTVTDSLTVVNSTTPTTCNTASGTGLVAGTTYRNIITSTSGTGLLAVVGIVAIASLVTDFVSFQM